MPLGHSVLQVLHPRVQPARRRAADSGRAALHGERPAARPRRLWRQPDPEADRAALRRRRGHARGHRPGQQPARRQPQPRLQLRRVPEPEEAPRPRPQLQQADRDRGRSPRGMRQSQGKKDR